MTRLPPWRHLLGKAPIRWVSGFLFLAAGVAGWRAWRPDPVLVFFSPPGEARMFFYDPKTRRPIEHHHYRLRTPGREPIEGITDKGGETDILSGQPGEPVGFELSPADWEFGPDKRVKFANAEFVKRRGMPAVRTRGSIPFGRTAPGEMFLFWIDAMDGEPIQKRRYRVRLKDGQVIEGVTDDEGKSLTFHGFAGEKVAWEIAGLECKPGEGGVGMSGEMFMTPEWRDP